ncbi:MAG: amidase family protein [Nevskia sp.]|nr:amidase family protein [Nevskia sp.]
MFNEYREYDATGLAALIARREVSASELLEAALARAAALNPRLNAICIPMTDIGRTRARASLSGPFAGVPFLIKDIAQDYAGVPTTAGSRALRAWTPQAHAEIVERFLRAGVVIFGKTSTPEFALKALTETALFGATRNPWDLQRTPGGSSGGAAAAVAAGIVPMAGASDGGGSIRIPASYCGLFGLRPSRGRVPPGPAHGEFWDGASSEHVLTRSVRDSARMLDALAGADVGSPFVIAAPERAYVEELQREPGRLRIGFSTRSPIDTAVDSECVRAVERTAKLLEGLGHHVEMAEPEIDGHALARCFLIMYFGQVAANMAEARALTGAGDDQFELDTRGLGMLGRALSAGEYVTARRHWNDFARALGRFHQRYDLLLLPSVAMPPSKIGEQDMPASEQAALKLALRLRAGKLLLKTGIVDKFAQKSLQRVPFTQLSNLTGTPSMSVPLHYAAVEAGGPELPVGVQFVARHGDEATLFRLAAQLEQVQPWAQRRPSI